MLISSKLALSGRKCHYYPMLRLALLSKILMSFHSCIILHMDHSEELLLANLALPLVKDLVTNMLSSITKLLALKSSESQMLEGRLEEYLTNKYLKHSVIDTLVFPNKQTLLKTLYEPLTIESELEDRKNVQIRIDGYPESFLPKYMRAIIEDTAGMGKSTITKKMILSIIEAEAGLPVLLELRQINKENSFSKAIQSQLSLDGEPFPENLINELIKEGRFIFLLDGFDEISKFDKEFVLKSMHKFIEKSKNNYFLITSRPEDSLAAFGDFQKFKIQPLKKNEANSLIRKYDKYSFKPIAEDLIEQIDKNEDRNLQEFLTNPLLVSLLYKSFEYKKDIPLKKSQFYRQIYDALFESHDLSKEGYLRRDKHSNLHMDDFERVLRYLGYFTSIENKVEYDRDHIINMINKVRLHLPDLVFQASDFLKDLLETVPIFKKDGNSVKWAHKSLQDYFAAKFLWIDAKDKQHLILRKIFDDEENRRFYNVLDIYYELDSNRFESTILLWLLEDFNLYCQKNYLGYASLPTNLLKKRLENSYHKEVIVVLVNESEIHTPEKKSKKTSSDFFSYYKKKALEMNANISHISSRNYKQQKVTLLTFISRTKNIDTILKLLHKKGSELVTFIPPRSIPDELITLNKGQFYKLTDDPENPLNKLENFDLASRLVTSEYVPNYDKFQARLNKIKTTETQGLENDLTNW